MSVLQFTKLLPHRTEAAAVPGVRIRTFAGPEDIPVWLELRDRAFAREKMGVRSWDAADFQREFLAKPWWHPERMWFAEVEDAATDSARATIVGTATLASRSAALDEMKPVVHWLAVLPKWRRRGIARLLMTTLEAACWDSGQRQIWLETHSAWDAATALYQVLGYRRVD